MEKSAILVDVADRQKVICHINAYISAVCETALVASIVQLRKSHERVSRLVIVRKLFFLNVVRKGAMADQASAIRQSPVFVNVALVLMAEEPSLNRSNTSALQFRYLIAENFTGFVLRQIC